MNRAPPLQAGAKDTTTRGSRLSVHLHGADGMRVEDNPHTLRPSLTNTGSSKSPSEKPSQAHVSASSFIVRFGCPREFLTVADIARVQSKSEARGWLFRCGAGSLPFLEEPNKQSTTRTHLPLASCQEGTRNSATVSADSFARFRSKQTLFSLLTPYVDDSSHLLLSQFPKSTQQTGWPHFFGP
jgi:hypothetical protein